MSNRSILLSVLLLVAVAQSANAASYYVATAGNDANPGTAALPFRTISQGVKVLKPGDTLWVRGGVYAESLRNSIPSGTSWSAPVTVAAYPGETVTIQPGVTGWPAIYAENRAYIVLDRLIVDGTHLDPDQPLMTFYGTSHHIRVQNSEMRNSPRTCVYVDITAHHNEFINVNVHHNGWNTAYNGHGIYLEGSDNLVERSTVAYNAVYGVHIYSNQYEPSRNIIRNNRIHDNDARGMGRGAGIILSSGNGNQAYNNLVWGNHVGIQVAYNTPMGSEVYNNTVYANDDGGIIIESGSSNSIIKNNILSQNGGTQLSNGGTGTQQSHNLIGGDPAFVNVSAYDFHLRSGSPAIDAGTSITIVTMDFDGNTRPKGTAWDIGAFEFLAGGSAPLAPTQVIIQP